MFGLTGPFDYGKQYVEGRGVLVGSKGDLGGMASAWLIEMEWDLPRSSGRGKAITNQTFWFLEYSRMGTGNY
jgi:hypothetical protein